MWIAKGCVERVSSVVIDLIRTIKRIRARIVGRQGIVAKAPLMDIVFAMCTVGQTQRIIFMDWGGHH